jgi:release factor glutamine methyltransferase
MDTGTLPSTVAQALAAAVALGADRLDAQLLLLHALGRAPHDRAWLLAHDDDAMPEAAWSALAAQLRAAWRASRWPTCWARRNSTA